jgi:hypothetical protein
MDWILKLIAHLEGLTDDQIAEIESALPATHALIELLTTNQQIIKDAQNLYARATPIINEAMDEWKVVGPALEMIIAVISKHSAGLEDRVEWVGKIRNSLLTAPDLV